MPGTARGRDPAVEEQFLGSLYKGGELLAAGKVIEAREHLEKAMELQPKNEKAQNLLGLTYFKLGLFDQAAAVYELLVRENPADPTLRVNIGLVYLKSNNLERAVKEFETATDLEPGHKKAHNYLGLALAQAGDYGRAREHFQAAGSDAMADKMEKALVSRAASTPSTVGLTVETPPAAKAQAVTNKSAQPIIAVAESGPLPPPPEQDEAIEVMSDDEVASDDPPAEVVVEAAPRPSQPLGGDWGAHVPAPAPSGPEIHFEEAPHEPPPAPTAPEEELRFAEDEGPAALQHDAPLMPIDAPVEQVDVAVETLPAEVAEADMPMVEAEVEAAPVPPQPPEDSGAREPTMWVTEHVAEVPLDVPPAPTDETWADAPAGDEQSFAEQPVEQVIAQLDAPAPYEAQLDAPVEASYAETLTGDAQQAYATEVPAEQAYSTEVPAEQAYATEVPAEQAYATEVPAEQAYSTEFPAEQAYATEVPAEQAYSAEVPSEQASAVPDEVAELSFADVATPDSSPLGFDPGATAPLPEPAFTEQPIDAFVEPSTDPAFTTQPGDPGYAEQPVDNAFADAPVEQQVEQPAQEPAYAAPVETTEPPQMDSETLAQAQGDAGYAPMVPQRLGELGSHNGWVQQPSAGPFQLGPSGLAVTVNGEMLSRMTGLVAVVGSVQVAPEMRRKRGRPTADSFGEGQTQLQRLSGNGVLYLEAGPSRFHAVDLTDQPGVSVDDEGAYLREEFVFAFEEAISFENGRVTDAGLALDLVHLKGHGRVLLALEGSLKAMPVPAGAPMVVPLGRLVGWFGRVTPRLMGFGGQGAVELTGDGFALLGTPS